jgi:ATP-dependent RNA helicase RhlE
VSSQDSVTFQDLGLKQSILKGVAEAGYANPTDIQSRAIPLVQAGKNVIALGQTGSGKTAAFGLPMLDRLAGGEPGIRGLILVPTRELCVQVAENLRVYAQFAGLHVRTAFGGIPISIQEAALKRGVDVLVACPGRLIDLMQCNSVDLSRVEMFVLDEADRMLDMGFIPQIRRVLARLPQERQNLMFSATMPGEVEGLVRDYFGMSERVQVGQRSEAASTITHRFETMSATEKEPWLERLLRRRDGTVLVFVKTKKRAEELGRKLKRVGLPADSIHGDKSAESRHVVLQAFSRGKTQIMVATDVAARGIDVSSIGLVVNFDMPRALEDYIHRVGRTGRAGSEGEAISLITRLDAGIQRDILGHMQKTSSGKARVVVDGKTVMQPKEDPKEGGRGRGRDAERQDDRGSDRKPREERGSSRRDGGERSGRSERSERSRPERAPRRSDEAPAPRPARPRRAAQADVALEIEIAPPAADGFGAGVLDAPPRAEGSAEQRGGRRRRR